MNKRDANHSTVCCSLCGQDIWQLALRGAYLTRVSPMGEAFVGECRPSCERNDGGQNEALLRAMGQGDS